MKGLVIIFVSLTIIQLGASAMQSEEDKVVNLTGANFKSFIAENKVVIVKFQAPWCGHCKSMHKEQVKLAAQYEEKGDIKVAAIDGTVAENKSIFSEFGVKGYPNLKLFLNGKKVDFKGARTAKGLHDFIQKKAKNVLEGKEASDDDLKSSDPPKAKKKEEPLYKKEDMVVSLTDDIPGTFKEYITRQTNVFVKFQAPWCGHCKSMHKDYVSLAKKFDSEDKRYKVVAVDLTHSSNKGIAKDYGVKGFPTLVYIVNGAKKDYNGGRDASSIADFIKNNGADGLNEADEEGQSKKWLATQDSKKDL